MTFELVQPLTGGESPPFQEFLATRGQGISHVVFNEGPPRAATLSRPTSSPNVSR